MDVRTICNPVNINYQYQNGYFGRESADPAVVLYKDTYFLFASHGSGYWFSDDLVQWKFIKVDLERFPDFRLFAPATLVIGDRMYITHCQGGNILYSDDPFDPDSWVNIGKAYDWNDPAFIYDDDGYVYIYEGLSQNSPLHVSKLDPNDNMKLVCGPLPIFTSDIKNRGYERSGDNNEREDRLPCLEGAWVNKIGGRYYLTYAVPGTEFSGYCDGVAVSDSPMGPFVNCDNSPTVFKNTGFMRGAGHGCLFYDKKGNLWKLDTVSISENHIFERRLCLFPSKIGEDGRLYTNTLRGDYPMIYPCDVNDPFENADAGWNLLSYGKALKASSVYEDHTPDKAADENLKTWWSAETGSGGEWIEFDLGNVSKAYSVQVNFADQNIANTDGRGHGFTYKYLLEVSDNGIDWRVLADKRDNKEDLSHEYIQFEGPETFRYIKLTNCGPVPAGGRFAVSGLRVFGPGEGKLPASSPGFIAKRGEDERNMTVSWKSVENAEGYIVRFGVNESELYTQYQVIGGNKADIGCLISGVRYYVTVDAYNSAGVIKGVNKIYV
jgi:hypothetical protein